MRVCIIGAGASGLVAAKKLLDELDALVVATGHHNVPFLPTFPGSFKGEILHSQAYKTPEPFRDRRVLVVGAGNSGCDIAVELSGVASRVFHSTRRLLRLAGTT